MDASLPVFPGEGVTSGSSDQIKMLKERSAMDLSLKPKGRGMTLQFKDLMYSVKLPEKDGEKSEKRILHGVSGFCRPGELLALMGPSGAGKTTLLNLLAGRKKAESGEVLINGTPASSLDKKKTGYVMQQDMFLPHLTVQQQLEFTALLRLPASWSHQKKMQRCQEVIGSLSLQKCLHTKLGHAADWGGGVSGGEKKRVSIASELLPCPRLLFLDEPTSGLDSTAALELVQSLKELALNLNATVVCSIHQPSSQVFALFDHLLLLMNGRPIYFGSNGPPLLDHFGQPALGLPCPPGFNMADHLMNIAKDDSLEGSLLAAFQESMRASSPFEFSTDGSEIDQKDENLDEDTTSWKKWSIQYKVLLRRAFINSRGESLSWSSVLQTVGVAILCGLVMFQRGNPSEMDKIRDLEGVLVFMLIFDAFANAFAGLTAFSPERAIIVKERASKAYPMSAYFLAKSTAQLLISTVLPIVFAAILYPLAGLQVGWEEIFLLLLLLVLHSTLSDAIGLLIGASFMNIGEAMVVCTVSMVGIFLFGGFLVALPSLPGWLSWLSEVSLLKHAYNAVMHIYVSPNSYLCSPSSSGLSECAGLQEGEVRYASGESLLEAQGLNLRFTECCCILVGMQVVVRAACYVVLRWSANLRPDKEL